MKQPISLVLSSGGSKGLAHIGAINELEKQGFQISSVSGSSIGSVIGGLYAMGKLPEYTDWVKTLNKKAIWGLMDFTISTYGLLKGEKVFDKMKTFIPDMPIEKMNIPFAAVATDILNEKEVVFKSGSFYEAVRASVAIPTILTPVKHKGTILVDGGILNPVPIEHVARNENDILVVVSLYGEKKDIDKKSTITKDKTQISSRFTGLFKNISRVMNTGDKKSLGYFSLLNASTSAMVHKMAKQNIEKYKPDIIISIPYDTSGTFDFHKAEKLIKMGESAANKEISKYFNSKKLENNSNYMCL
ncbi:MAG: patatin-like phospholipase family protein [Bacteroidales bacterium]|nr:patatin-like phospholipase family protein [Bacteroidales bacterium]